MPVSRLYRSRYLRLPTAFWFWVTSMHVWQIYNNLKTRSGVLRTAPIRTGDGMQMGQRLQRSVQVMTCSLSITCVGIIKSFKEVSPLGDLILGSPSWIGPCVRRRLLTGYAASACSRAPTYQPIMRQLRFRSLLSIHPPKSGCGPWILTHPSLRTIIGHADLSR